MENIRIGFVKRIIGIDGVKFKFYPCNSKNIKINNEKGGNEY